MGAERGIKTTKGTGWQAMSEEEAVLLRYFSDIADSQPLSRSREEELAACIKDGDMEARDELVQANLRFVIDVARGYQNRGLTLSELISAGNLGLITAAERFDGERGFKFISYAVWWIRQSILQTIAEDARTVRLPLNQLSLLKDISRTSRQLGQGREVEPDVEEIANELDLPTEQVRDILLKGRAPRSLDAVLEEGDDRTLMNVLVDDRQRPPDADIVDRAAREQIDDVLEYLDDRERYIIRLYFGLEGEESMTLEEIGRLMQLTRERVRQLKERALKKLRDPECYSALLALMEETEVY
jgi:RNA polymerase primary sigma factor